MNIKEIQVLLRQYNFDGWIFGDFQGRDFITNSFCGLTKRRCTRRLFYYIPVCGTPVKILSAIEPLLLDHMEGKKVLYKGLAQQKAALSEILKPGMNIACQYSPMGKVPTISSMDAGLIEYLKSFGVNLHSSADIMQHFGAVLSDKQIETHKQAGIIIHKILNDAFSWIRKSIDNQEYIDEWDLKEKFAELVSGENIHMDSPPFFGIDDHASDPGYEPESSGSYEIKEGSRLIVDIAGRLPQDDAIYYDVSWCMNVGANIQPEYQRLFDIVNEARFGAFDLIQSSLDGDKAIKGCDVDRFVQEKFKGYGLDTFIMHRTGHNIGHDCHGIGANLDNYETEDIRTLIAGTMFSIEPGLYTEKIGVRLEYDVHITKDKKAKVYGPIQNKILVI
ncbi:MAG: M24 family metallopeptidase [Oscillospiraceae bacterium]